MPNWLKTLLALLLMAAAGTALAEKRVALVIGNATYAQRPLKNPVNDAEDLAKALTALGFEVMLRRNRNGDELKQDLADFQDSLERGGVGLFYFSGHGMQAGRGNNYLLPVGREYKRERDVEIFGFDAGMVLRGMEGAGSRLNIVILDACRDSPLPPENKSAASRGLARMEAPSGSLIAFATAPGSVADDNTAGRNGLYTKHLLSAIRVPGLRLQEVFIQVGREVERESNGRQSPEEIAKLRDVQPFYFNLPPGRLQGAGAPAANRPDFSDLDQAQQHEAASRRQWETWQNDMRAAFEKASSYSANAEREVQAWERFLAAYGENNPYSDEDESLRAQARRKKDEAQGRRAAAPGDVIKDCTQCPDMVVIPAGEFSMGSPAGEDGRYENEGPQHKVRVDKFLLGRTEVTVGQWKGFVGATGYRSDAEKNAGGLEGCAVWNGTAVKWEYQSGRSWKDPGFKQDENHPVVCVSWNDAKAYAEWMSSKTGKAYRLASEAEWEYAARAGTQTARYWGDDADRACRYANVGDESTREGVPGWKWEIHKCRDGSAYTARVGSYEGNAWKLQDMLGNAWEWVEDCWHETYVSAPADGSAWTGGECKLRVLRGGAWFNLPRIVRAAIRNGVVPAIRYYDTGFRLARTVKP